MIISACLLLQAACTTNNDCCGGAGGTSQCVSNTCCYVDNQGCTLNTDCCGGACSGGLCSCFHGDEFVLMADGTEKQMKNIRIGDFVKTVITDQYTGHHKMVDDEIILRTHHDPDVIGNRNIYSQSNKINALNRLPLSVNRITFLQRILVSLTN